MFLPVSTKLVPSGILSRKKDEKKPVSVENPVLIPDTRLSANSRAFMSPKSRPFRNPPREESPERMPSASLCPSSCPFISRARIHSPIPANTAVKPAWILSWIFTPSPSKSPSSVSPKRSSSRLPLRLPRPSRMLSAHLPGSISRNASFAFSSSPRIFVRDSSNAPAIWFPRPCQSVPAMASRMELLRRFINPVIRSRLVNVRRSSVMNLVAADNTFGIPERIPSATLPMMLIPRSAISGRCPAISPVSSERTFRIPDIMVGKMASAASAIVPIISGICPETA